MDYNAQSKVRIRDERAFSERSKKNCGTNGREETRQTNESRRKRRRRKDGRFWVKRTWDSGDEESISYTYGGMRWSTADESRDSTARGERRRYMRMNGVTGGCGSEEHRDD